MLVEMIWLKGRFLLLVLFSLVWYFFDLIVSLLWMVYFVVIMFWLIVLIVSFMVDFVFFEEGEG